MSLVRHKAQPRRMASELGFEVSTRVRADRQAGRRHEGLVAGVDVFELHDHVILVFDDLVTVGAGDDHSTSSVTAASFSVAARAASRREARRFSMSSTQALSQALKCRFISLSFLGSKSYRAPF